MARQLKVSATTISFVLNGKAQEKRICRDTEEKILKYAEQIGFQLNHVAQSVRTSRSKIIAMLVEDISDIFFSGITRSIEEHAYESGYKIFNSSTENNAFKTKALIKAFSERQVDGYIIAPCPGIEEDIASLINEGLPVILFDRYLPDVRSHNIIIDNSHGAYIAVQHLISNGYTNIAIVTLDSEQVQMTERMDGYLKATGENNLKSYVLKVPYSSKQDNIWVNVAAFINKNKKIDAIFFATNYLAVAGLEALNNLGLRIPDEIGVVSFDDNKHFSLFSPSITAVAQPLNEISKIIFEQLMIRLSNCSNLSNETIVLLPELIIRQSTQKRIVKPKPVTKNKLLAI